MAEFVNYCIISESVTAAINYYRCSFQYPEVTKHINAKIPDVPVVSIFGTADKALSNKFQANISRWSWPLVATGKT